MKVASTATAATSTAMGTTIATMSQAGVPEDPEPWAGNACAPALKLACEQDCEGRAHKQLGW